MVKNILIVNIGIHILVAISNIPLNEILGLRVVYSDQFAPYQFFTYMWLHSHAGIWHLLGNMLMVFFIGPMLEEVWGSKRFLTFYLICGLGAGLFYGLADFAEKLPMKNDAAAYQTNPNPDDFYRFIVEHGNGYNPDLLGDFSDNFYDNPTNRDIIKESTFIVKKIYTNSINGLMVGASGAVFGILFALAYLFPNTEFYIYMLFPVKAKYLAFFLGMYALYSEFNRTDGDNVAHLAHLGGMLIAFILLRIWQKGSKKFY